jgi:cytochrome c553
MSGLLKAYSDQQIAALAGHYAKQKWVSAPAQKDEAAVNMGTALHQQRCAGCHGERGLKAEGVTPRLAGQAAGFLEAELNRYRDASVKRPNAIMRSLAQALKPEEVKALAAYYSLQSE